MFATRAKRVLERVSRDSRASYDFYRVSEFFSEG